MVKRLAMKIGVSEIRVAKERACLVFSNIKAFSSPTLMDAIDDTLGVKISVSDRAYVDFDNFGVSNENTLKIMRKFLERATKKD
jgi:hypothetical protein